MKRFSAPFFAASLALMALAGAEARADLLYNSIPNTPVIFPDDPSSSAIFLMPTAGNLTGSGDLNVGQAIVVSFAAPANPSTFTDRAFGVSVSMTDTLSGQNGTINLSGRINGTTTNSNVALMVSFDGPNTHILELGSNQVVVSLPNTPSPVTISPAFPGFAGLYIGNFTASVEISPLGGGGGDPGNGGGDPGNGGGDPGSGGGDPGSGGGDPGSGGGGNDNGGGKDDSGLNETPEPSTLVLSCLGLSLLGIASWRKRQRGRKAA